MPYRPGAPPTGYLADPLVWIVKELLTTQLNLDTNPTFPVYMGTRPDTPDDCITVVETVGTNQGRYLQSGGHIERNSASIMVRANAYEKGDDKARLIVRNLTEPAYGLVLPLNMASNTAGFYLIQNVSKVSGPIPLGKETPDSKRYLWSINILLTIDWFSS